MAYRIQCEETGTPEEFANKYDMKVDTLIDQINILRDFTMRKGAEVRYDQKRKTYYFSPRGKFSDFEFKEFT
jgi:hypothetical protein